MRERQDLQLQQLQKGAAKTQRELQDFFSNRRFVVTVKVQKKKKKVISASGVDWEGAARQKAGCKGTPLGRKFASGPRLYSSADFFLGLFLE